MELAWSEIDFSNAGEVARGIRDAVVEWAPDTVRVDLGNATFIDSSGLGALIEGYRAATAASTRFVVINPTRRFRRVLTVTGLCELFGLPASSALEPSQATVRRRRPPSGETGVVQDSAPGGSSRIAR